MKMQWEWIGVMKSKKINNFRLAVPNRLADKTKDIKKNPNKKDSDFYEQAMGMDWGDEE